MTTAPAYHRWRFRGSPDPSSGAPGHGSADLNGQGRRFRASSAGRSAVCLSPERSSPPPAPPKAPA